MIWLFYPGGAIEFDIDNQMSVLIKCLSAPYVCPNLDLDQDLDQDLEQDLEQDLNQDSDQNMDQFLLNTTTWDFKRLIKALFEYEHSLKGQELMSL